MFNCFIIHLIYQLIVIYQPTQMIFLPLLLICAFSLQSCHSNTFKIDTRTLNLSDNIHSIYSGPDNYDTDGSESDTDMEYFDTEDDDGYSVVSWIRTAI